MPWRAPKTLRISKPSPWVSPSSWGGAPGSLFHRVFDRCLSAPISSSAAVLRAIQPRLLKRDGALWVPSLDAALTLAGNTPLTPNATQHPDVAHQRVTAWIIGGGSVYAEALSREDLPSFGRVEIIERTFFYCQEGNEITGDTYAPELAVEGFMAADEPARWRILGESAWEKSERGYLLDVSGGKNPMYYSFQTLARL